jgi:hypothetical protein
MAVTGENERLFRYVRYVGMSKGSVNFMEDKIEFCLEISELDFILWVLIRYRVSNRMNMIRTAS